jgi:hypothetical protein
MWPIGCPEMSVRTATIRCVISQKIADLTRHKCLLLVRCGVSLTVYWTVFWDVTPRRLVGIYPEDRTVDSGKTLVNLYVFFWVIPRRLNFVGRRFGTLCLFHLHRRVWRIIKNNKIILLTYLPMKMEQTECSETSAYKIQTSGNYPEENIQLHWFDFYWRRYRECMRSNTKMVILSLYPGNKQKIRERQHVT